MRVTAGVPPAETALRDGTVLVGHHRTSPLYWVGNNISDVCVVPLKGPVKL